MLDPVNVNANGLQVRGVEFDYKTPRYHNYNVTLQTEIIPGHSIEVGYVGTRGRNLETFTGMNNVTRLLPPGTNPQQHVTWPNLARGSLLVRTVGVSDYDSLQMKFQRRLRAGLGFLVSYTLSDSTTNAGDSLSGGGVGGLRAPDVAGWSLENDIGKSGFYTKHALVFSGTYDLPGRGAILGGWRANWVASIYSGQAQTIGCSITTGAGTGCYALVVGDPYEGSHDVNQFYNPAAFANPDCGRDDRSAGLQPARRQPQPGDRSAAAAAGLRRRQAVQDRRPAAIRDPRRGLQPDEYAVVQPPGLAQFPRRPELRQHHLDAERAAAVPAGCQGVLVEQSTPQRPNFQLPRPVATTMVPWELESWQTGNVALRLIPMLLSHLVPDFRRSSCSPSSLRRRQPGAGRRPAGRPRASPGPDRTSNASCWMKSNAIPTASTPATCWPRSICRRARSERRSRILQRAQALDPSHYEVGYDLARALLETGRLDEARAQVRGCWPRKDVGELHNLLGDIEQRAGNLTAAAEDYQRAAHMDPSEETPVRLG